MWTNYWATLLSHWAKKEFDSLGYIDESSPDADCDSTEAEVHILTEVTTNCKALFHWQGYKARQNILIPNAGPLYSFLKEKNYRIANCVFMSKYKDGGSALFQVINYENVIVTKDYLAYEDARTQIVDNLEGCSLTHLNSEEYDYFMKKPVDALKHVLNLFGIKEWFK